MENSLFLSAAICTLAAAVLVPASAADQDPKAVLFGNAYLSLCMRNVNDLEKLRADLRNKFPAFPPQQAARFLNGVEGDAWPITSSLGEFVIALPKPMKMCSVYARRVDPKGVEDIFTRLVSSAPSPILVEKRTDERDDSGATGGVRRLAFVWGLPNASRRMMFSLTTSAREDAPVQALATATMISE